ncbi:MAG: cytochrome c oxidase subunit II [Gemmatimonadota bacterium]|jgi:cytochrome c oxidase subunit 2
MSLSRALPRAGSLAAAVLLAACAGEYPQSSIAPKSDFAHVIHDLYGMITWITLGILVVVWALLAYVLVRFRERPDQPHPRQIHGHLGLEIAWTIVPAIIVVAIAVPTVQAVFATQRGDPEDALVVHVTGQQFWWQFEYPETGVVTANELHLPVGRPVSLRLHSRDVIHSFWVPMLGGKRDVNPLRTRPDGVEPEYNWLHLTIEEPGVYMGQCAEFCGDSHSLMGLRVVAQTPDDFRRWMSDWQAGAPSATPATDTATGASGAGSEVAAEAPPAPGAEEGQEPVEAPGDLPEGLDPATVAEGRRIFENNTCIACHAIQGTVAGGRVGPNLTLLGRRGTVAAGWLDNGVESLVRWITAPQDIKPGAQMPGVAAPGGNFPPTNLSEEQVRAVAQYLYSLR